MAMIFILWAQEPNRYAASEPIMLRAFGDQTDAQDAMDLVNKCAPKHQLHITEVEFFGTVAREATDNGSLFESADYDPPPDPPKHPLVALAEKIHEEGEA